MTTFLIWQTWQKARHVPMWRRHRRDEGIEATAVLRKIVNHATLAF
jgi:hypothetical protein